MDIPDVSPEEPLIERYCHCVWEVRGRGGYNSYAVCSASVYNHRGLKGPGPVRCAVSEAFIRSLPSRSLRAFLEDKYRRPIAMSRDQLVEAVLDELRRRGELSEESPKK